MESLSSILMACLIWYVKGKDFRLPISLSVFFMFKYFIDLSVKLKIPNETIYEDLPLFFTTIPIKNLFYANCDPNVAFNLYFLINLNRENLNTELKKYLSILGIVLGSLVIFCELTIMLNHSFSMSSAVITFLFSEIVSFKLDKFL